MVLFFPAISVTDIDIYAGLVIIPGDVRCMKSDVPVVGWPMAVDYRTEIPEVPTEAVREYLNLLTIGQFLVLMSERVSYCLTSQRESFTHTCLDEQDCRVL